MTVRVVLDNEPVSLLSPQRRHDPARRALMARIETAEAVVTPRVVRVEAAAPRDAEHADLNRLVIDAEDLPLLRTRGGGITDGAASLRRALDATVGAVDAIVAATADALAAHGDVEVITSDARDFSVLRNHHDNSFLVATL